MWTTDGSSELVVNGNKLVSQVAKSTGNVYNGIWKEDEVGLKSGKGYWKIKLEAIEDSSLFLGVTDNDKFGKGWALKGLMFGGPGNLSSGGALLIGDFGPKPKSGNTVGIFVDLEGANLKIYFDVNGSSLGLAFDVPKSTLKEVFPAVSFSGPGTISIEKVAELPNTVRLPEKFEGIEGLWEHVSGSINTGGHKVTLDLKQKSPNSYRGSLRVINNIQFNLHRDNPTGPFQSQCGFSTMMGGSPEMMTLENEMTKLVSGGLSIDNQGEQLSVKNEGTGNNSVWKRLAITREPVTENPFA